MLSRDDRVEGYRRLSIRQNAVLTHATIIKLGEALDADQVIYGTYGLTAARKSETGSREQAQPASGAAESSVSPRDSLGISARILDLKRSHLGPESKELGALEDLASLETRSEERRVGKECRSRWSVLHEKKKVVRQQDAVEGHRLAEQEVDEGRLARVVPVDERSADG